MHHHHLNHHSTAQLGPSGRRRSISDPLAAALLPPPDETPEERERRVKAEDEAKKRSDNIDKMLREGERQSRRKKFVKVLLLGQSESGKSTTLKQFQLLHTPAKFQAERIAWRILEAISPEADALANGYDEEDYETTETASIVISAHPSSSSSHLGTQVPNYDSYRRRLAPLADLEAHLMRLLADPDDNDEREATRLPSQHSWENGGRQSSFNALYTPSSSSGGGGWHNSFRSVPRINIPAGSRSSPSSPVSPTTIPNEIAIPNTKNWKKLFALGNIQSPKSIHSGELHGWWENPEDPVHALNRCAPVIAELWRDKKVRQKLREKKLRLEESSGFYLDEIERITAKMYFPTDDDVLKARLKTTGVVEHTFTMSKQTDFKGVDWKIYDVGGARPQRHAWAPYFDDAISAFDQVLAEDPRVNRLDDSLLLWKSVVSNRLLGNVNIILFLNKCDLLKAKLESGVRLSQHMPGYRDRPNTYDAVSTYFRSKFGAVHQSYTPNKARELYNTRATRVIIYNGWSFSFHAGVVRDIHFTLSTRHDTNGQPQIFRVDVIPPWSVLGASSLLSCPREPRGRFVPPTLPPSYSIRFDFSSLPEYFLKFSHCSQVPNFVKKAILTR